MHFVLHFFIQLSDLKNLITLSYSRTIYFDSRNTGSCSSSFYKIYNIYLSIYKSNLISILLNLYLDKIWLHLIVKAQVKCKKSLFSIFSEIATMVVNKLSKHIIHIQYITKIHEFQLNTWQNSGFK